MRLPSISKRTQSSRSSMEAVHEFKMLSDNLNRLDDVSYGLYTIQLHDALIGQIYRKKSKHGLVKYTIFDIMKALEDPDSLDSDS